MQILHVKTALFMAALRSRCEHYIFVLFLLSSFFFFPRLMHVEKVASLDNLLRRSDEHCCQVYWSVAGYSVRRRDWADMAG